jgi:Na+-transporting NADH:ubiquinone oxidoreductase subunit C
MSRDSTSRTIIVASGLAIVCSLMVSAAAVGLRERQDANKLEEKQKNILLAAGLYDKNGSVGEQFKQCVPKLIDLATGEEATEMDAQAFDQRAAAKDAAQSIAISPEQDVARIGRRSKFAVIYEVKKDGKLDQIVLPIHGKGLWSTMYGFVSLDRDAITVRGVTFYEHGETAGLGGEVSNPLWNAKWTGKKLTSAEGEVLFRVVRGSVESGTVGAESMVDGLSGATLTSNGVTNLMHYWLGEQGFGLFLKRQREGGDRG